MSPNKQPVDPDQGALFTTEVKAGVPEAIGYVPSIQLEPAPEGHFEATISTEAPAGDPALLESIHAETKQRRHRQAQLGRHSPLARDGSYLGVKPGDVLPDFGVVTHRNLTRAEDHAQDLESKRIAGLRRKP